MAASDRLFLVSDAMAAAGSDLTEFTLNGRRILRVDGSLRLEDGTLAGADLALARAVALTVAAGATPETALAMATSRPAACLRRSGALGHLLPGRVADMVHLGPDLTLRAVWRGGQRIV
jgi:N-acetylglucosamine-6-phosphate deacetylase